MENQLSETMIEQEYLKKTLEQANQQLVQTKEALGKTQAEILKEKKEVFENTEHQITNLWSSEGFEALAELSQSIAPITDLTADCSEMSREITRLEHFLKHPYFARIDFLFEGDESPEQIYIGRTALTAKNSAKIFVYDWRSPIASVFYRFLTGAAFYDAPAGRITGEVTRKRQYEIQDGSLRYFFDTDRTISDEILKQLLSKNTSPKMKTIIETIQKEQDIVIRNMEHDLLMIQGVAGSGKTSVALHRAAYLMYQGLQARLSANNILILSPNTTFEQYISDVLPQLGEENVVSMVFEDLLHHVLQDVCDSHTIQPHQAYLEQAVACGEEKEWLKCRIRFKTSEAFRQILNQYIEDIPRYEIAFEDIYWESDCIAAKEELKAFVTERPHLRLAERLALLEKRILEDPLLLEKHASREDKNRILQKLQTRTKLRFFHLYRRLWENKSYFSGSQARKIRSDTLQRLSSGQIGFDDAIAMLYLYVKIYGSRDYQLIRHVIIDEAQDYYPLQYEILHMLFPNAKYTVLGDINQTLTKQETLSFYGEVAQILKKKQDCLVTLNKSFRCTNEILQFGLQFIGRRPQISSFNRSGENVTVMASADKDTYLSHIAQELKHCRDNGYASICLLCKTEKNCEELFRWLNPSLHVQQINDHMPEHLRGAFLLPSYQTKGLEFDAVIICDADAQNYTDADDRKLLYISCTRALHKLSIFSLGTLTPLIKKDA